MGKTKISWLKNGLKMIDGIFFEFDCFNDSNRSMYIIFSFAKLKYGITHMRSFNFKIMNVTFSL